MVEVLELLALLAPSSWRSLLPIAAGIGGGLAIYRLSGGTPASAAVAFAVGFAGLCLGIILEFFHVRRR